MSHGGEFEFEVRPATGDPSGAIVLLHGRGTDQFDLFPLFDQFDPERKLIGITPRAPLDSVEARSAGPGAHWYRLGGIPTPDPETFWPTYRKLTSWLDRLEPMTGVGIDRTIIGGFSQGAVMSYAAGLGPGRPSPAGLLAMSGFIPEVPEFTLDLESRAGLPVAISHGTLDPVIPAGFGADAAERLLEAGLEVQHSEAPVGHTIDSGFAGRVRPWIESAMSGSHGKAEVL